MRVLYVTHTAAKGGCAGSLRYLIENFPPGTVEPIVMSVAGPAVEAFKATGARVIEIPGVSMLQSIFGVPLRGWRNLELLRTVWFLRYGTQIRRAIRELKPDIVHLNERGMLQAAWIAHREGVPVVAHARSVTDRRTRWVKAIGDLVLNRYVSVVVPIDESVSFSMREIRHRHIVYNPLNLCGGQTPPQTRRPSSPNGEVRVTYLSGLLRFKGIWDLLEAARRLRGRSDVVFQIAGANSRPASFHRSLVGRLTRIAGLARDVDSEVRAWIAREELTNVRLLGHVDTTTQLLTATEILVFPSHLNGPGRSVYEAGVYGIPSVVTLVDKIEDVIEDGVTGLIVPERDPAALADAIGRLASDPALRARLGEQARRKYVVQFDPRRIAVEMLGLYRTILGVPKDSPTRVPELESA